MNKIKALFIAAFTFVALAMGVGIAHASPPPPIPGCGAGEYIYYSNVGAGTYTMYLQDNSGTYYLYTGDSNTYFCAVAESGGWQEIRDTSGQCLGVNGLTNLYMKPCSATRPFDLWTSGSSPTTALLVQNDWVNQNYSCTGTTLPLVLSTNSDDLDNEQNQMRCPDASGPKYGSDQSWLVVLQ